MNVKFNGLSLVVVVVFIFKLDELVALIAIVGFFVSIIIFLLKDNDPLSPGVGRATLATFPKLSFIDPLLRFNALEEV